MRRVSAQRELHLFRDPILRWMLDGHRCRRKISTRRPVIGMCWRQICVVWRFDVSRMRGKMFFKLHI